MKRDPVWKNDAVWPLLILLGMLIAGALLGVVTGMRMAGQL